jgi:exosortase A-associated hydrolase 1
LFLRFSIAPKVYLPSNPMVEELAIDFECDSDRLIGILHLPAEVRQVGVLIVVGGPQYRVGSHRQFVHLSRRLAANGYSVMRFDYRGLGDSEGEARDFERIERDISTALSEFSRRIPSMRKVVIWGLCDAATAGIFYASKYNDSVAGIVMLNPWVRDLQLQAQTVVRDYYGKRIFDIRAWRDLFLSPRALLSASRSIIASLSRAVGLSITKRNETELEPLVVRFPKAVARFKGPMLLIVSGQDLTAAEFLRAAASWRNNSALDQSRIRRIELADADHTFSSRRWRDQVASATSEWLESEFSDSDIHASR